jgi:hypothetical protein
MYSIRNPPAGVPPRESRLLGRCRWVAPIAIAIGVPLGTRGAATGLILGGCPLLAGNEAFSVTPYAQAGCTRHPRTRMERRSCNSHDRVMPRVPHGTPIAIAIGATPGTDALLRTEPRQRRHWASGVSPVVLLRGTHGALGLGVRGFRFAPPTATHR